MKHCFHPIAPSVLLFLQNEALWFKLTYDDETHNCCFIWIYLIEIITKGLSNRKWKKRKEEEEEEDESDEAEKKSWWQFHQQFTTNFFAKLLRGHL